MLGRAVSWVPLKGRAGDGSLTMSTTIGNCGRSKGGCSIINNSKQHGSAVDVCLSVLAVPLPCGPALSAESWRYPGFCFRTWNLDDGDDCVCLSPGLGGDFLGLMACGERWNPVVSLGLLAHDFDSRMWNGVYLQPMALHQGFCPRAAGVAPGLVKDAAPEIRGSSVSRPMMRDAAPGLLKDCLVEFGMLQANRLRVAST